MRASSRAARDMGASSCAALAPPAPGASILARRSGQEHRFLRAARAGAF